jgi:hypothetical protein
MKILTDSYEFQAFRDWALPDPHGQGIESVRQVRDSVIVLVDELLNEIRTGQVKVNCNEFKLNAKPEARVI